MKSKFFVVVAVVLTLLSGAASAQKMKAEDVVAKHLESIGSAEARASVKSRVAVGDATAKFISTKDQAGTTEVEWTFMLTEFAFNQKLDPKTFETAVNDK